MKINNALIMAAGRGMRMMPLTLSIPKAMAILDGDTLIASGIKKLKSQIDNIHITVGYKGAKLAKHVIEQNVNSVFNTEGKGNAWWIYNTLIKNMDEPTLVLTCDNVVELDLDIISEEYYAYGSPACMVVPVTPIEGLDGDYIFHENQKVLELNRVKKSPIYCSGIQVINPYKINQITEQTEDFYNVWTQLMALENLYCSKVYPKEWYAVDTIEQLNTLNTLKGIK